jgi:hypothetical protein
MRLNQENPYYKIKFGRKPKEWTIEMVHDLWVRAKDRSDKKRQDVRNCLDEIIRTVKPFDKNYRGDNEYRVFYTNGKDTCYYTISKSELGGHGYSHDILKFKDRDDKLTFLLSNQNAFELGQKFHDLNKLCSYQHGRVGKILSEMLNTYLRNNFKDYGGFNEVMTIRISNKSYYIKVDNSSYPYKKFELLNEVTETITIPNYI